MISPILVLSQEGSSSPESITGMAPCSISTVLVTSSPHPIKSTNAHVQTRLLILAKENDVLLKYISGPILLQKHYTLLFLDISKVFLYFPFKSTPFYKKRHPFPKNDTTFFNFEMIRKIDTPLSIPANKWLAACSLFRAGVS
jgi:hypothetical protein